MNILGISAFYHDSAAVILKDGLIKAAAQEERFTRIKHDARFPKHALSYALKDSGLSPHQIDYVAFYDKPLLKFQRLLSTYLAFAPRGIESFKAAMPLWLSGKIFQKSNLIKELRLFDDSVDWNQKLLFAEHHQSHAASAFFPSPFTEAAILTMDGVGEWTTTSLGIGRDNRIEILKEIHFPHSLGLLYSAFTYYTGFKVNSGEYKVMGLAPYGKPLYVKQIYDNLIDVKDDGSFRLNQNYFNYCTGLQMTNKNFDDLFGGPVRKPEDPVNQRVMDLAASIQVVTEETVTKLCRSIAQESGMKNLCLAGGVALNCVANGKVLSQKIFDNIWIQPAAGDAGGALGAAQLVHYNFKKQKRIVNPKQDQMCGSYLGPEFSQEDIEKSLTKLGASFQVLSPEELLARVAKDLAAGKAVGWHQGKMEFGPRALGARSILGDARSPQMQSNLNLKVKYRESFRPFAPAVLSEDVGTWFDLNTHSPYMLLVAQVSEKHRKPKIPGEEKLFGIEKLKLPRSDIPAVTHIDYSARVQTVHKETNLKFFQLLSCFKELTGCGVLVNTSFNVRGEPIVCNPEDSFRCFMGCEIEVLAIGNCYLKKEDQNPSLREDYKSKFELD